MSNVRSRSIISQSMMDYIIRAEEDDETEEVAGGETEKEPGIDGMDGGEPENE